MSQSYFPGPSTIASPNNTENAEKPAKVENVQEAYVEQKDRCVQYFLYWRLGLTSVQTSERY